MDWLRDYRSKLVTAEEAVRLVKSRERVYIHPGCATPQVLVRALLNRAAVLEDVSIIHLLTLGRADYVLPEYEPSFRCNALFIGANVREAVDSGRADYTPVFLSEVEGLFSSGQLPLDVVLLQVAPPDEHGFLSLGVSVDCTLTAARCARKVVAEVNPRMPRTHGDCYIHVTDCTAITETDHPLQELPPEPFGDIHRRIAAHVASLIPDCATLQTGIGCIPAAVLSLLTGHRDLGIHTELISDGVIPLMEAGAVTGRRKSLHPRKVVVSLVLGTERLFDYIHDNPFFEFRPNHYVNDPFVISQNENMVAINSALQVDLTGQVCSDSIGTKPYSGFGGQVDFIRGAARSRGGRPIIALPSTAAGGSISRIVPTLDPGAGVVTSRADVHYVVTEHGVAHLHGKTLRERAEALIAIADPEFRDSLTEFACREHYLHPRGVPVG